MPKSPDSSLLIQEIALITFKNEKNFLKIKFTKNKKLL
jgi:hypothetical protein